MGHTQLTLFPSILRSETLIAPDSPRKAFYSLYLEEINGRYQVRKASGIKGHVLDTRLWTFSTLEQAEKDYQRRLHAKLNPKRESPRKYQRKES